MTHLPTPAAVQLAVSALAQQGEYGTITALAQQHDLSRSSVYAYRDRAEKALAAAFSPPSADAPLFTLDIHRADLVRSLIGLRVCAPGSTRDIEDLLPILYGYTWSHGTIHALLAEAEQRAAVFNRTVNLSKITHGALDEMFSQGKPVFGGIDLDSGYLFVLEQHPDRSGATWAAALSRLRDVQKLVLQVVVKDAGAAMAQAVVAVWEDAEQRDDLFHLVYLLGKVAWWLEQRAYKALGTLYEWEETRRKVWKYDKAQRRSNGQKWGQARQNADHAIERYDRFEALRQAARVLLEPVERGTGRLRSATEVREGLKGIAAALLGLGGKKVRSIATYMNNRAAGLSLYLAAMSEKLAAANTALEQPGVGEAVVWAWQASAAVDAGGPRWDRARRKEEVRTATAHLLTLTERDPDRLLAALKTVLPIVVARHRASSAIENLNSVLRPYLVVQKGAHAGFLELFQFWWNTRTRRWGRHAGTSAYEALTGSKVKDWLTLLGYPPGPGREPLSH